MSDLGVNWASLRRRSRCGRDGKCLLGLLIPKEWGGAGMDTLTAVAVTEQLAKGCAATAMCYHMHQSGSWGDVGKPGSAQYADMDTDSAGGISVELVRSY